MQCVLIITAAGLGTRTRDYSIEKYGREIDKALIKVQGIELIRWSIKPFYPLITAGIIKFEDVYVAHRKEQNGGALRESLNKTCKKINMVEIGDLTKGPAHTTLVAIQIISQNRNLDNACIIAGDCDHTFRCNNLLSFFTRKEYRNCEAAICSMKSVKDPKTWGFMIEDKKSLTWGEKQTNIMEDGKKVHFLIGCYLYRNIDILRKGIERIEKENTGFEWMHSSIISKLSHDHEIGKLRSNWGEGLGSKEQLQKSDEISLDFSSNIEPNTYICDIDGVLLVHSKGRFSNNEREPFEEIGEKINANITEINDKYENGDRIVLFTSRSELDRENTVRQLNDAQVKYDRLILDNTSGTRILINDKKPLREGINTSESLNTKRNQELMWPVTMSIDSITQKTKGSGAQTDILLDKTKNMTIVRKWTESDNKEVADTLYKQMKYMELINAKNGDIFPKTISHNFSDRNISYFDMEKAKGKTLRLVDVRNDLTSTKIKEMLIKLYEKEDIKEQDQKDYGRTLNRIIDTKLLKALEYSVNSIERSNSKNYLKEDIITASEDLNKKLKILRSNSHKYWQNHVNKLIHGDLTLENIMYDPDTGATTLIDPLGATMDPDGGRNFNILTSPVFDLGKLMQSTIAKYEEWAEENMTYEEVKNEVKENFSPHEIDNYEFIKLYKKYLGANYINDGLIALVTILIRVAPYRIRANKYESAVICIMRANQLYAGIG